MSKPTARQKRIIALQAELQTLHDAERDALYDRVRDAVAPVVALLERDSCDKDGSGLRGTVRNDNTLSFIGARGAVFVAMDVHEWEGRVSVSLSANSLTPEQVREFLEALPDGN